MICCGQPEYYIRLCLLLEAEPQHVRLRRRVHLTAQLESMQIQTMLQDDDSF